MIEPPPCDSTFTETSAVRSCTFGGSKDASTVQKESPLQRSQELLPGSDHSLGQYDHRIQPAAGGHRVRLPGKKLLRFWSYRR